MRNEDVDPDVGGSPPLLPVDPSPSGALGEPASAVLELEAESPSGKRPPVAEWADEAAAELCCCWAGVRLLLLCPLALLMPPLLLLAVVC